MISQLCYVLVQIPLSFRFWLTRRLERTCEIYTAAIPSRWFDPSVILANSSDFDNLNRYGNADFTNYSIYYTPN